MGEHMSIRADHLKAIAEQLADEQNGREKQSLSMEIEKCNSQALAESRGCQLNTTLWVYVSRS